MTTFHERLTRLVGQSTWREPMGGVGTDVGQLPPANVVAAALAMARRHPSDIGPDLAVAIYLRTDYKRDWIVRTAAAALASDPDPMVKANRQFLRWMAEKAFDQLVHGRGPVKPEPMRPLHWSRLYPVFCHILNTEAEDAVARASAKARAA